MRCIHLSFIPSLGSKKTNNTLSGISLKVETILNYAKSKKKLTRELNERISSMLEPLDRDIKNHVEEEDDLLIALNLALKKRNENLAWEEVEKVKTLNEVKDPLLDLENCSLHELISILQKFASDPSINTNQAGFGSYIANHVLKEKIARYNQEAMIPPKLGDMWIPKVLVTIGKETHHAILDLGSSVSVLSKELYEVLELKNLEKCSIELALADDSIKHALGKVSDVMVELHMTFVPVDFLIMDMGSKTSSPIILGRLFLRTTGAIIDSKEGNVKFQFPHKKCMEHFPRKREPPKFKLPHELRPQ